MKSRIKIVFIVLSVLTLGLVFISVVKLPNWYFGDYTDTTFKDSYSGKVIDIIKNRGGMYVELDSNEKYMILDTYNESYSQPSLFWMIEKGDYLVKPLNSDSIFLTRNSEKYFFILNFK